MRKAASKRQRYRVILIVKTSSVFSSKTLSAFLSAVSRILIRTRIFIDGFYCYLLRNMVNKILSGFLIVDKIVFLNIICSLILNWSNVLMFHLILLSYFSLNFCTDKVSMFSLPFSPFLKFSWMFHFRQITTV